MALTVRKIEAALRQTRGNVSAAARELGVTRSAIYAKIASNPALRITLEDIREEMVDIAESALYRRLLDGDMTAIAYVLNNNPIAKRRGWGARVELVGAGGDELRVRLSWPEEDDGG